ncbi:2-dehydropantoate 2-reductase [Aestuariivita boseongensis]|uniref:2-dehydropantoate 2-reductase n=1 Tax=Aestuariivita boseongensis TaxID=1470562 RepID=UPI000682E5A3|nr:2-dehydropantoate 2-reductase [Aestuariivita boseongensis]
MTRIVIAGAGSIGCFVGGLLQHAGHDVALLGRPRILNALRDNDLRLTDFTGLDLHVTPQTLSDDPAILATAELILVTVKSGATADMARLIATHAPADAPIISLQNGMDNARCLTDALPGRDIRAGMVPFNVVPGPPGHYHRATSGDIVIEQGPGDLGKTLTSPALPLTESDRIRAVQWGKLLINLTNAINALSGLPLLEMLKNRAWRRLMADQMEEAQRVLRAAGIQVASTAPVPMTWVPRILRLPTPIYTRIAASMLRIDRQARTSMAYDLREGRLTEVDQLQGVILDLARAHKIATPTLAAIHRAVKSVEGQGPVTPALSPDQIRAM